MKKTEKLLTKTGVVWFGALICCALWGSAFPCIKMGYQLFKIPSSDTPSQILFAGYRFMLAGLLTIVIGSILSRKVLLPKVSSIKKIVSLSMLQTVIQYLFFYIGLAHTTGVKASIIGGMNVFVAILIASLLFHQEELTSRKLLGCLIGFAGVVLININGSGVDMKFHLLGEGAIFLSTIAYAFSSVYMKKYSEAENPVMLSGWQFMLGGVIMSICGGLMGGKVTGFTPASTILLVYMGMISAVAYSIWGILLKYNPVSKVTVFGFMNPVFGVLLSAIILGETQQASGIKSFISLVLVCIGIYIVNYKKKTQQTAV
ncbi:MAG: DMT family transporter [Lachnospiraceae bacterium]